jgi:copper chaperone NosL
LIAASMKIRSAARSLIGPRVSARERRSHPTRYRLPTALLAFAAGCLVVSIFLPYWTLTLHAPQYPKGLRVRAYLNHLTGDVSEIDGLNHYIGMRKLAEAAQLERSLSIAAVFVLACLVASAVWIHTRFAAYLALPALLFPAIFLADLQFWLLRFGTHLDPHAPLSHAIKPFVPPVLGKGYVGQFSTTATIDFGLALAIVASLAIAVGLYFHWRAYRPLVDAARSGKPPW